MVGLKPYQVVLEQSQKDVLKQRPEMRNEVLAGFNQLGNSWRAGLDLLPCPPVVAVAFKPQGLVRNSWNVNRFRLAFFAARCHRASAYPSVAMPAIADLPYRNLRKQCLTNIPRMLERKTTRGTQL